MQGASQIGVWRLSLPSPHPQPCPHRTRTLPSPHPSPALTETQPGPHPTPALPFLRTFKSCEGDGQLGLVVWVLVEIWPGGVERRGLRLVRVHLDGQRRVDGEDLEQEGQVAAKLAVDVLAEQRRAQRVSQRAERLAVHRQHMRRPGRVGPQPQLEKNGANKKTAGKRGKRKTGKTAAGRAGE